jgi:hypothetical protein
MRYEINLKKQKTSGATAEDNTSKTAAKRNNFNSPVKQLKMGKATTTVKLPRSQKKKATSKVVPNVFVIPSVPTQAIEKLDLRPRMTKKELKGFIKMVEDQCEGSIMIDGYEENIIGYDYNTNAIIYDGDEMLNYMADDYMAEDIADGVEIDDTLEYYEQATDYLNFNISGGIDCLGNDPERPRPIILMRFPK